MWLEIARAKARAARELGLGLGPEVASGLSDAALPLKPPSFCELPPYQLARLGGACRRTSVGGSQMRPGTSRAACSPLGGFSTPTPICGALRVLWEL